MTCLFLSKHAVTSKHFDKQRGTELQPDNKLPINEVFLNTNLSGLLWIGCHENWHAKRVFLGTNSLRVAFTK
jgi:hypothetical protein